MQIADTYSSWCRALLTPDDRARIATAGTGTVRFSRPHGKWCARVDADGRTAVGFHAKRPGEAFDNALVAMRQAAA
jgi:hypothetical protein